MTQHSMPRILGAAFLAAAVLAAVVASKAFLSASNSGQGAGAASSQAQIISGCEPSPAALSAIEGAAQKATGDGGLASGPGQAARVQSICQQGDWAYAFVERGGEASHPEVVLAQLTSAGWQVLSPDMGAAYNEGLQAMPEALIPSSAKALLLQPAAAPSARFSGFALPWTAGESAYVVWHWYAALDFSIGTVARTPSTIRNAKGGVAVFVKDSSGRECGSPPPDWYCWMAANAVVIQSEPNEYAWYLHMAQNSVPDWIQEGVYVPAGAELGQEGATGWAVSPHLHFQVASSYSCCDGEGDSRIPHWPFNSMGRVDFVEYSWEGLPWQATSQNQPAEAAAQAPPPADPADSIVVEVSVAEAPAEPPPPPAEAASAASCPSPYVVQRGEWLLKIAEQCGVSLSDIVSANPGLNPQRIFAGQALNMPGGAPPPAEAPPEPATAVPAAPPPATPAPPAAAAGCTGTHVVAPGENLFRIAFNCGLTTQQMAARNGIGYPYTIYAGQVLQFP